MTQVTPEIMRNIGKLVSAVYGGDVPPNVQNTIIRYPVKGIGLIASRKDFDLESEEVGRLINKIPADLEDPKDKMSFDCQGAFWIGYYHYAKLASDVSDYGRQELETLGKVLYGEQWQSNLSRDLGLSSSRRMREWVAGDRKIPIGIWDEISGLLKEKQLKISELLKDIK